MHAKPSSAMPLVAGVVVALVLSACAPEDAPDASTRTGAEGRAISVTPLALTAHKHFSIAGRARGLFPGAGKRLRVRVRNPHPFPIKVVAIRVRVRPDPRRPLCPPRRYIRTTRLARPLRVRARSVRLARRVRIRMLRRAPDGCQGAVFPLRLRGRAVRV